MKACDTNVVVRFLTSDDPRQAAIAAEHVRVGLFISHSVLMETEWVLRSRYGWTREYINEQLSDLIALQTVEVDQIDAIYWALDRHRHGADWADMIHLIAARGYESFVTFDKRVERGAGDNAPLTVDFRR